MKRALSAAVLSLALTAACNDPLEDRSSFVERPRVLAVRAEPPEGKPGESVSLTALIVGPSGTLTTSALSWGLCNERKPLSDPGPMSPLCVRDPSLLQPIGEGSEIVATLPKDGCRLFGPDRPVPKEGEPSGRPVDADPTGGYYQPILMRAADVPEPTLSEVRLSCGIGAAPQPAIIGYGERYVRNTNPVPGDIVVPSTLRAGQSGFVRIAWPTCETIGACGGAETFAVYDAETRTLGERREVFRVSWFATRGSFEVPRTGESADGGGSVNTFTVPSEPGVLTLWVVVRDDRGGVAWREASVSVLP